MTTESQDLGLTSHPKDGTEKYCFTSCDHHPINTSQLNSGYFFLLDI